MSTPASEVLLAVDTSTRSSLVALGNGEPLAVSRREVQHRHGSHVLEQIDEVLDTAGVAIGDVDALVVGTGPGSFTGLRVGLATVKTLAYSLSLRLVGILSSDALRRAAAESGVSSAATVVMPAGARDHYLARPGEAPRLIAPGDLHSAVGQDTVLAVDLGPELLGDEAAALGRHALEAMPAALLSLASERLATHGPDVVSELVPAYVALPRGVSHAAEDLGWSPDLR